MKKNFFKLASLATAACFACALTFVFQSCNSDTDELVQNESVEMDVKTSFKSDLRIFAMKQKLLNSNTKIGWNSDSGSFEATRASGMTKEDYCAQVERNLKPILENYDLTADLTAHELEGFNLSQEEKEVLSLDEEAYRAYIKEYKTEAFCNFFDEFAANPMKSPSLEQALNNDEMKMNEMLQMAIVLSVFENNSLFQETHAKANQEAAIDCHGDFKKDEKVCFVHYAIDCTLAIPGAVTGTPFLALAAVAWATYNLGNCIERAEKDYKNCVKSTRK